jgi:peptidoglycan/xylan/chitin deacetylase (PgdA/CDA1 family)
METAGLWMLGIGGVAAIGAAAFSHGLFLPRSQLFGDVLFRGDRGGPARIALTFDDGPNQRITPAILDCLGRHGAKAAFFVVGRHAVEHADLIERIHAEGHIVCNHSFDHAHLGTLRGVRYWLNEIQQTDAIVASIIKRRPALFRPPMGFKTHHIMRAARQMGHHVVTWTKRGYDGVPTTPERVVENVRAVQPGDVIVLHDGAVKPFRVNAGATAAALDTLLDHWTRLGVCAERLDQLLGLPAYAANVGEPAAFA